MVHSLLCVCLFESLEDNQISAGFIFTCLLWPFTIFLFNVYFRFMLTAILPARVLAQRRHRLLKPQDEALKLRWGFLKSFDLKNTESAFIENIETQVSPV